MSDRTRSGPSIAEIRALLEQQALAVAQQFAPPARGSYLQGHEWWTLNPGRPDKSVGSFVVQVSGSKQGTWNDFATGEHGDLIDLIRLSRNLDLKGALDEARRWLGITEDTPQARRDRQRALEEAARRRAQAESETTEARARRARAAHAIWLEAQPSLRGTPAEAYLRDARGIDLAQLGRQPRALRFSPRHRYVHTDPVTGEIFEGEYPALLGLVSGPDGGVVALHRTWLAEGPHGWNKAPVPAPKKVLGHYWGGSIHIWSGTGPRGGKGCPLSQCAPGARVYIAEGIEDALSVVVLAPHARVLAGISLGNLRAVALPEAVTEVVLVADQDESPEARKALQAAIRAHAAAGRRVRLWQNRHGGKDLNDALRAFQREME
ncbi:DUF7146 domain-containing protein [Pararhodobacter sp.]|uniref:DUF7146 domain-containing protein n=1 Tax=Pararhodobacter sp. TaxID=2127056 RepID=UPI002FDD6E0F